MLSFRFNSNHSAWDTLNHTYDGLEYKDLDSTNFTKDHSFKMRETRNYSMAEPTLETEAISKKTSKSDLGKHKMSRGDTTILIQDAETDKQYTVSKDEFVDSIDTKLGNSLLYLTNPQITDTSFQKKAKDLSLGPKASVNFRLPGFPSCKTCDQRNDEFLQNKDYIVLNDSNNTRILFPKKSFIRKLYKGSVVMDKDVITPGVVKDAIERYQIKHGASKERDVDYNLLKDANTTNIQRKLKMVIRDKKAKNQQD